MKTDGLREYGERMVVRAPPRRNMVAELIVAGLLVVIGAPARAEPYRGPCLFEALQLLRQERLPITLGRRGHGSPEAVIARRGREWVVQKTPLDPAAASRASAEARAAGRSFMPEDADACCRRPAAVLLAAPTREALELRLLDGVWDFESVLGDADTERFTVTLVAAGANPAGVVDGLRARAGMTPAVARAAVTGVPALVVRGAKGGRTRPLVAALRQAGARVQIEATVDLYQVVLREMGPRPGEVVEEIMGLTAWPADEAKAKVRRLPAVIARDLELWTANWYVTSLRPCGAKVAAVKIPVARHLVLTGM
jgi:ribosomal protein L7/L12